jgi:hypothetical protein
MKKTVITILVACLGIIGCAPIIPTSVPLGTNDLVPVFSKEPITLVNSQEVKGNTTVIYEDPRNPRELETNFYEWTNEALVLIGQWLSKYQVPIVANAQKTLRVSISNVKIEQRSLTCTTLTLNVETGDGIKRNFPVDMCAMGLDRSAGYAINLAVVELIHDSEILRYVGDK